MKEITAYFRKLPDGQMAVVNWPDITFPARGFEPNEGVPYTYTKVRHPEQPRFEHEGKRYVVCTATPVEDKKPVGSLSDAFGKLGM